MYLSRSVVVDPAHRDRNVLIHFEATGDRFSILVNGRQLKDAGQVRSHSFTFNVTPLVKFGEENLIELAGSSNSDKTIKSVEVWFYEPGAYP